MRSGSIICSICSRSISGLVILLVTGLIVVFFALYYRGSPMPRGEVPERKSHEIEIGWTVATLFLLPVHLLVGGVGSAHRADASRKDALEIHVVAKQWMWRIQHPSGAREIDELHVPADTNVRLAMTSQDVIHDLYLPALRLKQDILPDRYTYLWFNANKTGIFHLTCAEFCGTDHSVMVGPLGDRARRTTMRAGPRRSRKATTSPTRARRCFARSAARAVIRPGSTVHAPDLHGVYGRPVHLSDGRTVDRRRSLSARLRSCCRTRTWSPALRRSCRALPAWRARASWSSSSPTSSRSRRQDRGRGRSIAMTDATLPFVPPLESGGGSYLDEGHTLLSWLDDHRSQAHRHPLCAVDHRVLLHRRHRHRAGAARTHQPDRAGS